MLSRHTIIVADILPPLVVTPQRNPVFNYTVETVVWGIAPETGSWRSHPITMETMYSPQTYRNGWGNHLPLSQRNFHPLYNLMYIVGRVYLEWQKQLSFVYFQQFLTIESLNCPHTQTAIHYETWPHPPWPQMFFGVLFQEMTWVSALLCTSVVAVY